ncbi:MAG: metal-dependent transcriptional regulator [Stomatobaculum sp.]|nr:metal-dependent transcriptional regulator [Stomatobaculum sp.]
MQIHESAEDYLEQILMLHEKKGVVRSIDIANSMGYSKPSISIAMKHLRENGYVVMNEDNYISLTEKGSEIANRIYNRHRTLTQLLMKLGVPQEIAEKDACKIEHDLSPESYQALKDHMETLG